MRGADLEDLRVRSEAFAARTDTFLAMSAELHAGVEREATLRRGVTLSAFAMTVGVVAAGWPPTPPWLVSAAGVWIVARLIGNAIVSAWAQKELRRIKAAYPMPSQGAPFSPGPTGKEGESR